MFRFGKLTVRAFSMLELLVVMILSTIVIGALYFSYYTVFTSQKNLVKRYATTSERFRVYYLLKRELDECPSTFDQKANQISCNCKDSSRIIQYSFHEQYVIRQQTKQRDTFMCHVSFPMIDKRNSYDSSRTAAIRTLRFQMDGIADSFKIAIATNPDCASLIQTHPKDLE